MQFNRTTKILWFILLALGVMLCIRELREPDLWWQLRTGEWMLENRIITYNDIFSYTYPEVKWINVKWGYEVILAFFSNFIGPESSMILNMVSVVCILVFIKKTYLLLIKNNNANHILTLLLTCVLFLILHNSRINGRPEMTTYTLTAVYLYLFTLYRVHRSKWIYMLIPLQIFWTNMHEAYGVGVVMIAVFLVGSLLENRLIERKKIKGNLSKMAPVVIVSIISFLAVLINPNGSNLLDHYIEIYTQLQENKFTTENFSFRMSEYWNYVAYLNLILFLFTFFYLFLRNESKGKFHALKNTVEEWGVVYVLLYFAFLYLSIQASRNTFFFALISIIPFTKILATNYFSKVSSKKMIRVVSVTFLLFYLSIGTGALYKTLNPRDKYGLKVSAKRNPLGASKFIMDHNIVGKGFVDYLNSSYLLWSLQPDFKTYLDLRDLDIYPQKFMENVFTAYEYPNIPLEDGSVLWDAMVAADSFDYVVMSNNEQFLNFNRYLTYKESKYELVHADGVTSTYLSRNKYPELVDSLGFKMGDRDIFESFQNVQTTGMAKVITYTFWPFYNDSDVDDVEERLTRKRYYELLQ